MQTDLVSIDCSAGGKPKASKQNGAVPAKVAPPVEFGGSGGRLDQTVAESTPKNVAAQALQ